mgnify:CR=1 FL=1
MTEAALKELIAVAYNCGKAQPAIEPADACCVCGQQYDVRCPVCLKPVCYDHADEHIHLRHKRI